jgi:3-deoxy-D-manno-octulosonic-acid transferase
MLPPMLTAYRLATQLAAPFMTRMVRKRAASGKEDGARLAERFANAPIVRPDGRFYWLHGASVGECGMLLALQAELARRHPHAYFLMTSGTVTSAAMIAARAPARTIHQFAPLDTPAIARRFIAAWRPDMGVFAESDLWPNQILESQRAGIPLALVNARMSPRSLRNWRRMGRSARRLLSAFHFICAADRRTSAGLGAIVRAPINHKGNLKLAAAIHPPSAAARDGFSAQIAGRPTWVAASTHAGEDEIVLSAHARLREAHPDALLIIAPRHPDRGAAIAALAGDAPRRALGEAIGPAPVYVLDTIGELMALYAASPVALICGSLLPNLRGHNPIEPTSVGCAVISGPFVESFSDLYDDLFAAGGASLARNGEEIAAAIGLLWSHPHELARRVEAARGVLAQGHNALKETADALDAILEGARNAAA